MMQPEARFGRRISKLSSLFTTGLMALGLTTAAQAATFTVTTTNDTGSGSLRQAITSANTTAGVDTIAFNIAGSGVKTINVGSELPLITEHAVIDGTTQPGFAGAPLIELRGTEGSGSGLTFSVNTPGAGHASAVKSLVINSFDYDGIYILLTDNVTVTGCRIGTNAAGTQAMPNYENGIYIHGSANNVIGGNTAASRNLISGNFADGILIAGNPAQLEIATNNTLLGNYIGTDVTGALPLGNGFDGVHIENASGNTVGGVSNGQPNRIAFNGFAGIYIPVLYGQTSSTGNVLRGNSIFENSLMGIDLANQSEFSSGYGIVTPNDSGDADSGGNNSQNFPLLGTPTTGAGGNTVIDATFNSRPNRTYVIDFYASDSLNDSGKGEGKTYISPSITVITNSLGTSTFDLNLGANYAGKYLTAVATQTTAGDGFNDTSEFSAAVLVPGGSNATLQFDSPGYGVNEGSSTTITVTRTGNTEGIASVVLTASPGTASSPADFIASSTTLQFAAGQASRTVNLGTVNDTLVEGNETVSLNLSSPTGATLGSQSFATLVIVDNDQATSFTIAGRVTESSGTPVAGVSISRGAGTTAVLTDSTGNYILTDVPNGTYTLTPTKAAFGFTPATRSVTVNGANSTAQNFTAATTARSIIGRVANHSGVGIPNVQVTRNGANSVFTNANGDFTFVNVVPGTYTIAPVISPALNGVTLYPASRSVTVSTANITNQLFQASFRINGRIASHSGAGIAGVQVQRSLGASVVSAFTNSNGDFTFTDVRSGNYNVAPVLTPALSGMSFTPTTRAVTVATANLTNINYIGMFSVSGRVATSAGTPLPNVLMRLTVGASSTTALTDAQGNFRFSNMRSGSYTLTASQTGRTFSPASRSVTVGTLSLTNQNFTGSG